MLAVRVMVSIVVTSMVAGGWVTTILLSARPVESVHVISMVVGG